MPSYYIPELKPDNSAFILEGKEFHHICQVMRNKIGDYISITNGNGMLANAQIVNINKKSLKLHIKDRQFWKRSEPRIALAFALLKNKHDSMIIEKATEIGCADFYPLHTIRTVRKASANTVSKFQSNAIAAIKQCDNAWLPQIHSTQHLDQALITIQQNGYLPVVALELPDNNNLLKISQNHPQKPLCIVIGPEGGFSDKEIDFIDKQNIITFSLGNHILRAETAAIASVSILAAANFKKNSNFY